MFSYDVLVVLVFSCLVSFTSSASLPKTWIRCKQSSPDFNNCLKEAVPDALRKMKNKGVPSLGMFSMDPLDVTEMDLLRGAEGPVNLNLKFKNLQIHGIAESTVMEYNATLKDYKLYTRSMTPAFRLVGEYEMGGRILVLPVTGKGKSDITLEELEVEHFLQGEPFTNNGKKYMKLTDYRITLNPKRFIVKFDNLFNGDKRLGETMNRFMNDNWREIFPELRPALEVTFGQMFKDMSNRIFTKVPLNDIFLP